jgi:hypothetical protein
MTASWRIGSLMNTSRPGSLYEIALSMASRIWSR